jgi:Dolichyl-phosphate-mannose-protein mannosyltransferase
VLSRTRAEGGAIATVVFPFQTKYTQLTLHHPFIPFFALACFWTVIVTLVNPIGNFPLHDDWAFSWTVRTLLETGQFRPSDWTATNTLSQVLFGALFCFPFGFSFNALRLSTLTLGFIGVIVTYALLREVGSGRTVALLGALLIAIDPLYFSLANSFMTDVPSFTFFISAVYFLFIGLKRPSNTYLVSGIFLSVIAVLNRQSNLIIVPAFSLAYLSNRGLRFRTVCDVILMNVIVLVSHIAYSEWLKLSGRAPFLYNLQIDQLIASLSGGVRHIGVTIVHNLLIISVYLGLLVLPLLIITFSVQYKSLPSPQRRVVMWPTAIVVLGLAVVIAKRYPMPLVGNILNSFDLGGQSIAGYQAFLVPNQVTVIARVWQSLTVLGVIGAALLATCALRIVPQVYRADREEIGEMPGRIDKPGNWQSIFVIALLVMYCLPISALEKQYWFDRYLVLCLPLAMMVAVMSTSKSVNTGAGVATIGSVGALVLFFAVVTIAGTHDALASNRLIWQAINHIMRSLSVPANQINGGFEFEGWYFANKLTTCNSGAAMNPKRADIDFKTFTCLDNGEQRQYTISYLPEPGYRVQDQYSFRRWWPWREQKLYVLHRAVAVPPQRPSALR